MPKTLVIVSHTPHYHRGETVVGWGPTVREIDMLATRFENIVHIAPLHREAAPESALPYRASSVTLRPLEPLGGTRLIDKLNLLLRLPTYAPIMLREFRRADVVHVRCPAGISLMALLLLMFLPAPRKRWFKYAGNWKPGYFDSAGYVVQRWWLARSLSRGKVSVNGHWPDNKPHMTALVNPCLTRDELDEARTMSADKPSFPPLRLIFVGRADEKKGVGRSLEIMRRLLDAGLNVSFDIVGDDPQRAHFEQQAADLGLQERVCFHGWLPRTSLGPLYAQAHIMLFPSDSSEGWPKVISEAMAYGVVPVASDVSSIPQYLRESGVGVTCNAYDLDSFTAAILDYARRPDHWQLESTQSMQAAARFSYDVYLQAVMRMLELEA